MCSILINPPRRLKKRRFQDVKVPPAGWAGRSAWSCSRSVGPAIKSATCSIHAPRRGHRGHRHQEQRQRPVLLPRLVRAEGGYYEPPAGPGFGYELDEAKITSRAE